MLDNFLMGLIDYRVSDTSTDFTLRLGGMSLSANTL
jgi:hypothetical protein